MPTRHTNTDDTQAPQAAARGQPRLGIRGKMILIIVVPTLIIYVVVLSVMLGRNVEANERDVKRTMIDRAANYAARFDGAFARAAAVARATASIMESAPEMTEAQIFAQLRANVQQDLAIYGAAMAFEPGTFKADDSLFCPYVHRQGDSIADMHITREVYDWYSDSQWQWWHAAKLTNAPTWSDPYFDKGAGNVLMVTYSVPFTRRGTFRGVTTVDIEISKIREQVGHAILGDTEFILLTNKGEFVYSASERDIMSDRTVFDVARDMGRDDMDRACRAAVAGSSGVAEIGAWHVAAPAGWERWSEQSWIFFAPVASTGWTFAAIVPQSVAFAPARARIMEMAAGLGVALALILACIFLVSTLVTRPVSRLVGAVRRIASGDLDHRVAEHGRDELGQLGDAVNVIARDLKLRTEQIAQARSHSREAMIFAMARLTESRDDDTGKHLERICCYSEILATAMAEDDPTLDKDWIRTITVTAALHDIGKVGIPDSVLKKPGSLTTEERKRMQSHTTIGGDTLIDVRRQWEADDFLRIAAEIALGHHERWDGTGYPYGLAGSDISLPARIVAVADVYDAMTSKRVYKPPISHEETVKVIVEASGTQFDPQVIAAFMRVEKQFRAIRENAPTTTAAPLLFEERLRASNVAPQSAPSENGREGSA